MSSAAVQPSQQQPSPQQHYSSQSSAASPHQQQSSPYASSSRRANNPGRSSFDNASHPASPQQTQYSPAGTMATARTQQPAAPSSAYAYYMSDQAAPTSLPNATLPIRTSAQHTSPHPASPSTAQYETGRYATSSQSRSAYGNDSDRTSESERRRTEQRSPRDEQTPGSTKSQRSRTTPTSSRSATAIGQPPLGTELPRENSAVINRIVVDDPQADLVREEMRKAEARPQPPGTLATSIPGVDMLGGPVQPAPQPQRRQEHLRQASSSRKEVKFGDYILGQTLGEGEFGKVKMGWKKDSTVQVAIKLIRKESLAGNTTRLPKIYREIAILRELQHPNIVRLHEFVETERHMGIILEYASGGELFDYILNHRYLKDPAARRLFAQLVSGVGYLHKKGIVHRDLKLENLLLDRNKHIIITDFGFANTFDPNDELGEEVERNLHDKAYVKREGLDQIITRKDGREGAYRRGDLMQTSCGSPCYAAPELVVSDGLYTGRKVDVWSCGVILYAMLAGYLPFDDDPANPEGDNINLLYKYITTTPLTFPEYVTPHARDLLRRILVPDPRKRADLFEVARHSWLSEYGHVVGFIGSTVKPERSVALNPVEQDSAYINRSASVREPGTRTPLADSSRTAGNVPRHAPAASMGGDETSEFRRQQHQTHRDAKRNTVQLEYVPPFVAAAAAGGAAQSPTTGSSPTINKTRQPEAMQTSRKQDSAPQPISSRPGRDSRSASDNMQGYAAAAPNISSRPGTGGALGSSRLPSRGNSYSQPSAAQPTNTTVQGSFSQPKPNSGYIMASPGPLSEPMAGPDNNGRPVSQAVPTRIHNHFQHPQPVRPGGGHKRSSTLGSITDKILNRTGSKRASNQESPATSNANVEKRDRRYPPVSMKNAMPSGGDDAASRASTDSRRPSFSFARKGSRERESSTHSRRHSRRFSILSNFSVSNILGRKESGFEDDQSYRATRPGSRGMPFGMGHRSPSGSTTHSGAVAATPYDQRRVGTPQSRPAYDKALPSAPRSQQTGTPPLVTRKQFRDDGYGSNLLDEEQLRPAQPTQAQAPIHVPLDPVERFYTPHQDPGSSNAQHTSADGYRPPASTTHMDGYDETTADASAPSLLRPQQRKFEDAYEHGSGGSSSAGRRVMDFFRRRGKDRSEA